MTTRTQTKQEWRQQKIDTAADPAGALATAWDWLRASLGDLAKRRDPDPSVRARNAALGDSLAAQAAAWLRGRTPAMDKAAGLSVHQVRARHQLVTLIDCAPGSAERMHRAMDAFRWSARQLARRERSYKASRESAAQASAIRQESLLAAAEFIAGLAARADYRE